MKKFILICFGLMVANCLSATVITINVTSNQFSPANANVLVGDTIRYHFVSGFHNAISGVVGSATGIVPTGAAAVNSGAPSSTNPRDYDYKVTVAGSYRYYCQVHSADGITGMVGFFTASANAVIQVAVTNFQFTPANFNATVGDTVRFVFGTGSGFHNAISTVVGSASGMVPTGAPAINSGAAASNVRTYDYKIITAGNYRYYCQIHSTDGLTGMVAFFTANAALPANLKGLDAKYERGAVNVSWQTLTEQNVDYFTVKRSFNGIEFTDLAKVKAIGNSSSLQSYQFTDDQINSNYTYIYYSLATVDKDGKQRLSPIVMAKNTAAVKKLITSLSPNPISQPGHLMLQFNAEKAGTMLATVYNAAGKKVIEDDFSAVPGLNNGHLHMGDMPPGIYNIIFSMGKLRETHRVVVK